MPQERARQAPVGGAPAQEALRALIQQFSSRSAFVRELITQTGNLRREPAKYFDLISRVTKHPAPQIARSWEHHDFPLAVAPDLLNILVEEDKWVAAAQSRPPRPRAELASYIDTSIIDEARKR